MVTRGRVFPPIVTPFASTRYLVVVAGAARANLKAPFVEVAPAVTFFQPLPFLRCSTTGRTFFDGMVPPSRTFSPVIALAGFTVRVAEAAASEPAGPPDGRLPSTAAAASGSPP